MSSLAPAEARPKRNIRLVVAYDGQPFSGWQIQPGVPTIQGEIEAVLEKLTQAPCRIRGAGRTDAGVHAECQIATFLSDTHLSCFRLHRSLNSLLPKAIAIRSVDDVDANFDPRRGNFGKRYRYRIYRPRERDTLITPRAWRIFGDLDLQRMARAAQRLVGRHDFAAFRAANCQIKTTTRTLYRVSLSFDAPLLIIDVEGTAFLKNMVRILVGTLVSVGRGHLSEDDVSALLLNGQRRDAGITAPARGLTLERVFLR
ncbi:MAG: tRNA pseudouridine(38-40) synthase TruA [Deltaproteobacteria bacterium]|nr:tRNA pseudouridine(38-40) synthase TruA [Deltaproteobacteria bacterium]